MVNWSFFPMCKVQSVEIFISSTDATGTTGYLSYKIISLIDNSQNKTKKQRNKQTKKIYIYTSQSGSQSKVQILNS